MGWATVHGQRRRSLVRGVSEQPTLKFFLPDWDDRVDPGYHFLSDRPTLVRDAYRDDRYAHELLSDRVYNGLLVSRMALNTTGPKRTQVEQIGMRAYLRLPAHLELLGDCGAFGYVAEKLPLYTSEEIAAYYDRLGFDLGVSVDHLIVPEFDDERTFRYDLTLRNAEVFLREHRQTGYHFTPIAAVQGWDAPSYVEAASACVAMGYDYLALGGLARSNTRVVEAVVRAVAAAVPAGVRLHVFGIARLTLLPLFVELGIASVDSASPLRQAWLSAIDNYYTLDRTYAAIRIPIAVQERPKSGTLVGRSRASYAELVEAEQTSLTVLRGYDKGEATLQRALDALAAYDRLLADRIDGQSFAKRQGLYRETLKAKPWKRCPCGICRELGVEVIIFRGNNRNRRRGFHNLCVVQRRIQACDTPGARVPLVI